MSLSQYVRAVNTPDRPSWLWLKPGNVVYVRPDPSIQVGAPSLICDSTEKVKRLVSGDAPFLICSHRSAGQSATIVRIIEENSHRLQMLIAEVRAIDNTWNGFVPLSDLVPKPPLNARYMLADFPDYAPGTRIPSISGAEGSQVPQVVGNAQIRILRYDSTFPSGPQALVEILKGRFAHRKGWVDAGYIRTSGGWHVTCFCNK